MVSSKVIYRRFVEDLPRVVSGEGFYLTLADGSDLLDLSGGPGAASLGYSNKFVIETMRKQMEKIPFVFSGFWASNPAEIAGRALTNRFHWENPDWLGGILFQGSGSEAVDLALKLAAQYHFEGGVGRELFGALEYAFHGVTTLPYAATGEYERYAAMDPYRAKTRSSHIVRIRSPYGNVPVKTTLENTAAVFKKIGNQIAAVIVEPIGGPPVGAAPLSQAYLTGLRYLCDEFDVLLIYDEIFCGAGRCGALSVAKLVDVWPDISILGKSLTGGYQPTSAICLSNKVAERIKGGSGDIMWGTTYGAHTLGCAAVAAVQEYVERKGLFEIVRDHGSAFESIVRLYLVESSKGAVVDVNANGFLIGFRFVDPKTGENFPASAGFHARVRRAAWKRGVNFYTKGGTVKGAGDFGILAPAFEMSELVFTRGVSKLALAVQDALEEMKVGYNV